jgi:hypothetical protein
MTDVLIVATRELGDPCTLVVSMKAADRPKHGDSMTCPERESCGALADSW